MEQQLITSRKDFYKASYNIKSYGKEFVNTTFSNFEMSKCLKIFPFSFTNCTFTNIVFEDSLMEELDFVGCHFVNCVFNLVIFDRVNFDKCNFTTTNFSYVSFVCARIVNCIIPHSNVFKGCTGIELTFVDENNQLNFGFIDSPIFTPICPEYGTSLIGYKKAFYKAQIKMPTKEPIDIELPCVVTLYIPKDALRSNSTSRKCRCNKATVLSITSLSGKPIHTEEVTSTYDPNFIYKVGQKLYIDGFDRNRWNECAPGIHFFMTKREAIDY